ncbi:hypothetical protein JCM18897A_25940 [Streptomyces sp. JCM 18897]
MGVPEDRPAASRHAAPVPASVRVTLARAVPGPDRPGTTRGSQEWAPVKPLAAPFGPAALKVSK